MRTRYTFSFAETHFICVLQMGQWALAHDNGTKIMPVLDKFDTINEAMDYAQIWSKEVR